MARCICHSDDGVSASSHLPSAPTKTNDFGPICSAVAPDGEMSIPSSVLALMLPDERSVRRRTSIFR